MSAEGNPIIAPYPNWEANTVKERTLRQCNGIISVWRMQVMIKSFKLENKPMKKVVKSYQHKTLRKTYFIYAVIVATGSINLKVKSFPVLLSQKKRHVRSKINTRRVRV